MKLNSGYRYQKVTCCFTVKISVNRSRLFLRQARIYPSWFILKVCCFSLADPSQEVANLQEFFYFYAMTIKIEIKQNSEAARAFGELMKKREADKKVMQ